MANATQPEAPADADALLDQYLGVSDEPEDTPKVPRKAAQSGDPENQPPEPDEPDEDDTSDDDDAVEEDDTDAEDDAEADKDGDQSEEDEEGRFVGQNGRVKLPDGSTTTVAELMRGNLRMSDYTRKTQETGALSQELQARLADYAQQEQIVSLTIDLLSQALPPEPDPAMLQPGEGHDPMGYTSQKLLWEHASKQLQGLMQAKQDMAKQQQAVQGALLKRYALEQKDKLLGYHPELRERPKLEAYNNDLLKTLSHYGKGAEDLAQVYDADIIRMVEDLGKYRKIMAARKAARRKSQGAPVLAPGPRQSPQGRKARTRANDWEQLRKTGGKGSGEAALDRILDDLIS